MNFIRNHCIIVIMILTLILLLFFKEYHAIKICFFLKEWLQNFYEVISSDAIFDDNFVINHKKSHLQTKMENTEFVGEKINVEFTCKQIYD